MNTHGHHSVADDAGIPLLKHAFGEDARSIQAFYLGNWLTDVSQAVDPVAYAAGSGKVSKSAGKVVDAVKDAVQTMIDEMFATFYERLDVEQGSAGDFILKSVKKKFNLDKYAAKAKARVQAALDIFVDSRVQERDSRIGAFFRNVFLVVGYFKFVHPEQADSPPKMDFEGFMRVFGRPTDTRGAMPNQPANDRPGAYTQYYPHEHLDRPEILPSQNPPVFSPGRQIPGNPIHLTPGAPRPGPRSMSRPEQEQIDPDLYSYLRDYIEMTAGLLAEVDLEFEKALTRGFRDSDYKWHLTLAKLGHALHQVEDFFAHSNWVELAATRLGEKFLDKAIPEVLGNEYVDRAYTLYKKRLKRHLTEPLADWTDHREESWVATGFFDFQDTLISLAHIGEEAFGFKVPDPYAKVHEAWETGEEIYEKPETVAHKAKKTMRDSLDLLTAPSKAFEDPDNEVARSMKDKYEPDIKKMQRPRVSEKAATKIAEEIARQSPLMQAAPAEVQKAFMNAIIDGSRVGATMSIYGAIREIIWFLSNPVRYIIDFLPGWVIKKVIDAMKFYAKERFYDAIGAGRIGCHSLMAKDHGYEPFYEYQKHCATAVHWYIVNTLLRWKTAQDEAEGEEEGAEEVEAPTYIDWLQLLEYFLRNPLPPKSGKSYKTVRVIVPVTVPHVTVAGDQLDAKDEKYSLTKRYRKKAFDPARFTWRTIADANFGTHNLTDAQARNVINATLRDKAWGYPVRHPNYAFKPDLRLRIPSQKALLILLLPATDDPTWFKEVMENKDWKVFRGREDEATQTSTGPLEHHKPVPVTRGQLDQIIQRGKKLRRQAREAYRPQ